MLRLFSLCFIALAAVSGAVHAKPVTVRVVDAAGRPVRDAVVTVRPAGSAARPMPVVRSYTVGQRDMQFQPFVLVVPAGAQVSFPNFDPTKHHVYSFSPAKRFELKLFAKDQSRSVRFDKSGIVALGCNIHDAMSAFIVVADSRWTAATDANGFVRFGDVPASAASLTIWHPYLRAPANQLVRPLAAADASELVAVRLRAPPMHNMSGY